MAVSGQQENHGQQQVMRNPLRAFHGRPVLIELRCRHVCLDSVQKTSIQRLKVLSVGAQEVFT
jgi:hypothetical protein